MHACAGTSPCRRSLCKVTPKEVPLPHDSTPTPLRVIFGGDAMLGRLVREAILAHGADYPLGPVSDLMRAADLTIVNLECAITASERLWHGAPKAFYFGAPPQAADSLAAAGVDMVSLANNHLLDYDERGLRDTLHHLREHGIASAGAGADLAAALAPAIVERDGVRFGMASFCDHQEDYAATASRPGIAYLDLSDEKAALAAFHTALEPLRRAGVDWPILALHWGPNMVFRPQSSFRHLAHRAIDMGWKILFGHSAHVFHGIELYRGCPLMYATGDLVDDYYVDPAYHNDHQLLFELHLSGGALTRISLHPLFIADCQVRRATGRHHERIAAWIARSCEELGTRVRRRDGELWIDA